jgi:sterol desaturase/sphingolipid hydroxylase (fatty acid hydroxylase superfamily)
MSLQQTQLVATLLVIAGAALLIYLERKFPYQKGQPFFREGFFNDFVMYNLIQSFVLGLVISYLIVWIDSQTMLSRLQLVSSWPVLLQFIFFLAVHDFYIYWFHRLQHRSELLWRLHEAHHSTPQVDWLSGSRSHALEIFINQTIEFAPIVLLGAAPEIAVYKGLIDGLWGMYIHSNIDIRSGWLQLFINGPEMHRWHHSVGHEQAYNKNFSTKFAIWDWMFGTAFFPDHKKPEGYGLGYPGFPVNYFKQQLHAFRPLTKHDETVNS